jgi:hypothetical protein
MKKLLLFALAAVSQAATPKIVCAPPVSTIPPFTWSCRGFYNRGTTIAGGTIKTSFPVGPITITAAGIALTTVKQASVRGNSFVEWGLDKRITRTALQFGIPILASTPTGVFTATFTEAGAVDATVLQTTIDAPASTMLTVVPRYLPLGLQTLISFTCEPQTISGSTGGYSVCTAALGTAAASGGAVIDLSSTADIVIPAAITIPGGVLSGSFTVTIGAGFFPRLAPITATYMGISKIALFTIQ